ncbi:MAG: hypothetical protein LZ167_00600 [Thaumarchaeota archaeon]|jgi:YHS domain-containing protein|nr:hypothetical protein [Candidatus Geocrenenecus arthurdayi]
MSWETLVVGSFKLKDSLSKEERRLLIDRIKNSLELPADVDSVRYGAFNEKYEGGAYYFCHVNWNSYLDEEKIESLIREIRDKIENYDVTLYYLDNGVCFFRYSESGEDRRCEVC